jgi:VWFA-related protein
MAIFTLTGSLGVLQDFTSDPQILYAALQRYRPQAQEFASAARPETSINTVTAATGGPSALTTAASLDPGSAPASGSVESLRPAAAAMVASAQAAIRNFEGAQVAYAEDQRALLTLGALNSLARILGGLPGRKNIIWVTGNLPFSFIPENRTMTEAELGEDLPSLNTRRVGEHAEGNYATTFRQAHAEAIRETSARLSSAQVAVYPVDARGLSISTAIDSQESMREMARDTGGRAYVNQNEIKLGVERAFEDTSATYTLGYYPDNKKYDGKYRQIKVKVKRDGVEVQNRRGYYAIDPTQMKGYNPDQEVASALGDAVPATQVAFSVQVKPPAVNSVKGKIGVTSWLMRALFPPRTLPAANG